MTREQAVRLWPIIKAFSEGKQIQMLEETSHNGNRWTNIFQLQVNFNNHWRNRECPYCIKPEPREFWLLGPSIFYNLENALTHLHPDQPKEAIIRIKEVCPT